MHINKYEYLIRVIHNFIISAAVLAEWAAEGGGACVGHGGGVSPAAGQPPGPAGLGGDGGGGRGHRPALGQTRGHRRRPGPAAVWW